MHVLKLDSDGLFFSVLFCSSICPSSSVPPRPHVPNRRPRGPFPRQMQNHMTDCRTCGLETCPRAAATAAPTAAAPWPPSRPRCQERLRLLATQQIPTVCRRVICLLQRKKWKKLETPA